MKRLRVSLAEHNYYALTLTWVAIVAANTVMAGHPYWTGL